MLRFVRKFGTFKRPSPGYMFKRPVVPSDLQTTPKKHVFDIEDEKWCEDKDKDDGEEDIFKLGREYTRTNPYNNRED